MLEDINTFFKTRKYIIIYPLTFCILCGSRNRFSYYNLFISCFQVWLSALVILPARSHIYMCLVLVSYLTILSICVLPKQVWMDQLGRVAFLSGILFIMLGFGSDFVPPLVQLRTPPSSVIGLPNLPSSL